MTLNQLPILQHPRSVRRLAFQVVCALLFSASAPSLALEDSMSSIPLLHYDLTIDACQAMDYEHQQHQHDNHTTNQYSFANQGALKPAMSLQRNVTATSCSLGMGVQAKHQADILLSGSELMGTILSELQDSHSPFGSEDGLTMTFWFQHDSEKDDELDDFPKPLLTIGATNDSPSTAPSTPCGDVDFQVSVICNQQLEWLFRTSDPYFTPCQRMVVDLPDSNTTLAHITISLASRKQQLFYNGKLIAQKREMFDNKARHWDHSSELRFLSHPSDISSNGNITSKPWGGKLFQFSMFSGVKNEQDISELMSEGLPPTQPYAIPVTTHILEDAMGENNSLQSIQLPITYLDQEVDKLLSSMDIVHQPASKPRLYITRFPSRGTLISPETNHAITPVEGFPVLVHQEHENLIFLPLANEHSDFPGSTYVSFEYCWTTNLIVASAQCSSAAVSVVVDAVNDPPVAIAPPTYHAHEGIIEEKQSLRLTGFDVDSGDYVEAIQITTPPALGYLFLSVGTFRAVDNLLHGTLLSDIENIVPGKEAHVEYRFTGYDQVVIQDNSVVDYFSFRVQDSKGAWSDEVKAKIHILPNIFQDSDTNITWKVQPSDNPAVFLLSWDDHSGLDRASGIFVESLPTQGTLRDKANQVIREQYVIPSTSNALNVSYFSSPEACGLEDHHFIQDSFSYRVVSLGSEEQITSISNLTTKILSVQCPMEPLLLKANQHAINVTVFSRGMGDPCSGYNFNFSNPSNECDDVVVLTGVYVQNPHQLPQPILVSITTLGGFVTLNREVTGSSKLVDDQEVMRSKIRLLSPSDKLQGILSNIHYQSETVGSDEIRIVVQYGQCHHIIKNLLENMSVVSGPDCFQEEIVVPIKVYPSPVGSGQYLYREFPWIPFPFTIFMIFFIKLRGKTREIMLKHEQKGQNSEDDSQNKAWQQLYCHTTGHYYYRNLQNGEVTWEAPSDDSYIPWDPELFVTEA